MLMIFAVLLVLGLCLGSFVNALVWRLHEQAVVATKKNPDKKYLEQLSIMHGRSICPYCKHVLVPKDLIPVVSWVLLLGKCRYCRHKIEDTPFTELALPILYEASYIFWPMTLRGVGLWEFVFWLVFLPFLLALAVYDLRWKLLPDKIVFPLVIIAVIQVLGEVILGAGWVTLFNALVGMLVISGIFYLIFQISRGSWIGGGDVKLGLVLGLLSGGFIDSFLLLFIAALAGSIVSIPILVQVGAQARLKVQIPFGPFLILGLIVVTLFGSEVANWYSGLLYKW